MSILRKYKKLVTEHNLLFIDDAYINTFFSIIVTCYILSEKKEDWDLVLVNRRMRYLIKHPNEVSFNLEDPEFLAKTIKLFKCYGIPDDLSISILYNRSAFVVGRFNSLIAPFINNEVFPLREDGMLTTTLRTGKVYPIVEG